MNQPYHDDEMETVHVYIYEEPIEKPSHDMLDHLIARGVQVLALGMLAAFCLIPYTPVYATKVLVVPAHFLPVQVYHVTSVIVPTGKTEHPALQAHGVLTIYNGLSVIQELPAGVIVVTKDGSEVATDQHVTIAAAVPPSFGLATVPAHAVQIGSQGNIPAGAINQMYGSSLTIKNLNAFTGGQDASTEQFMTPDDRARAREQAREQLTTAIPVGLLAGPCHEQTAQSGNTLTVTWSCQYVTYTVPTNVQVLSAHVEGTHVVVQIKAVVFPA